MILYLRSAIPYNGKTAGLGSREGRADRRRLARASSPTASRNGLRDSIPSLPGLHHGKFSSHPPSRLPLLLSAPTCLQLIPSSSSASVHRRRRRRRVGWTCLQLIPSSSSAGKEFNFRMDFFYDRVCFRFVVCLLYFACSEVSATTPKSKSDCHLSNLLRICSLWGGIFSGAIEHQFSSSLLALGLGWAF